MKKALLFIFIFSCSILGLKSQNLRDSTKTGTEEFIGDDSLETIALQWAKGLSEVKQEAHAGDKEFKRFTNFYQDYLDSERCALFQLAKAGKINYTTVIPYMSGKKQKLQNLYNRFLEIEKEYPGSIEERQRIAEGTSVIPATCNLSCTNVDFSSGDFTGWNGYYAINNSSTSAFSNSSLTGGPLGSVVRGAPDSHTNTYQMHITSRANNDWFLNYYHGINMSQASPWGSGYSAMIGDSINNGSGQAFLSQKFQVTSATNSFTYAYSVLLENPNHNYYQQPFFSITMFDQNGDTIYNCGVYHVVSGTNLSGFTAEYYPPNNDHQTGGAGGGGYRLLEKLDYYECTAYSLYWAVYYDCFSGFRL